jgi:copper chaperone CopZ
MNRIVALTFGLIVPFVTASWAAAETKVTVEKVHLCCGSCVKGVSKAVTSVTGATAKCDAKAGTVTITAADEATAQKAVDAMSTAGYFGKASGATLKDESGAPAGNVKSLTVSGIHNCCKKCSVAINEAIKKVPGATGEVKPKTDTFTVTGDFDAGKLVEAFNEAGFSIKVSAK